MNKINIKWNENFENWLNWRNFIEENWNEEKNELLKLCFSISISTSTCSFIFFTYLRMKNSLSFKPIESTDKKRFKFKFKFIYFATRKNFFKKVNIFKHFKNWWKLKDLSSEKKNILEKKKLF